MISSIRKTSTMLLALALSSGLALAEGVSQERALLQLQFSPDGEVALAQDDSEIIVLAVEPFHVLFRTKADKGVLAQFTPDSQELVLVRSLTQVDPQRISLEAGPAKVERWSVRRGALVAALTIPQMLCGTVALAPDGQTLACNDLEGNLHVLDVASSKEVLTKRKFAQPFVGEGTSYPTSQVSHLWLASLQFSPDGRFLVAYPAEDGTGVIWDARQRLTLRPEGPFKQRAYARITFLSAERAMIFLARRSLKKDRLAEAATVSFPGGRISSIRRLPYFPGGPGFSRRSFRRAADPEYLILQYEQVISRGVIDLWTLSLFGRVVIPKSLAIHLRTGLMILSDSLLLDVYGTRYIEEIRPGEVRLNEHGVGVLGTINIYGK